jgi:tetratricopeptide (TPR) repeat protein
MVEDGEAGAHRAKGFEVKGRGFRSLRGRKAVFLLTLSLLLLQAVLAAAGCGKVPRIIVLSDPLTAEEHLALGVAYERNGEFDLAIREYEKVPRKGEAFFQARVNLGNVWLAKKEYGKARAEYREALSVRPGDPEATNNLAWVAILSGEEREDAAARMEAVLSRQGNRTATLLDTIGVLRMHMGQPAVAEESFADAERLCLEEGEPGCPGDVLREIRDHRAELHGRFP